MPSPRGRPEETVRPDVSECRRMPARRRPVNTAARPCAPSWASVTTWRVRGHATGASTSTAATTARPRTTGGGGAGWPASARCHTSRTTTSTQGAPPQLDEGIRAERAPPGPSRPRLVERGRERRTDDRYVQPRPPSARCPDGRDNGLISGVTHLAEAGVKLAVADGQERTPEPAVTAEERCRSALAPVPRRSPQ